MIRGKGEALSPAKINRDRLEQSCRASKRAVYSVCGPPPSWRPGLRCSARDWGCGRKRKGRGEKGEDAENRDVNYRNMGEKPNNGPSHLT